MNIFQVYGSAIRKCVSFLGNVVTVNGWKLSVNELFSNSLCRAKTPSSTSPILLAKDFHFGIHLQWFAPEDEDRTEDPTEYKKRKAREEGKVAKSSDITSALVMLFGLVLLFLFSATILHLVIDMMRYYISLSTATSGYSWQVVTGFWNYLSRLILPIMMTCFLAALIGEVVQVGFSFSIKPIMPDFSRIQPNFGRWMRKSFYSPEALFNLFKSITKVSMIAILAYWNIKSELPNLTNLGKMTPLGGLSIVSGAAVRLMLETALLLLTFAILDYFFQRQQHQESLKMTRHEVKEEYKESEGDPLVRSRLRQRMQEVLASNMIRTVPEADVVITNPTHFAVALQWKRDIMQAPKLTAKGIDEMALRIREIAKKAEVPVVENRPLARALYNNVEIGDEIPSEYWDIVSVILSEVYRLSGKVI